MKKLSILILAATLIVACSKDSSTDLEQLEMTPQVEVELSKMIPAAEFDTSENGKYIGTISTLNLDFHATIWINVGNDGSYGAVAKSNDGQKASFELKSKEGSVYTFKGSRGSFDLDLADLTEPVTRNVTFDDGQAFVTVSKETGGVARGVALNYYTGSDFVTAIGFWDFIVNPATGTVDETIILLPAPYTGIKRESAFKGDYEAANQGDPGDDPTGTGVGCYGPAPLVPFFLSSSTPPAGTDAQYELFMHGQVLPFPATGRNVIYDFGFSKEFMDLSLVFPYNQMRGNANATLDLLAPGLNPPGQCQAILLTSGDPLNGIWAEVDASGTVLIDFGAIVLESGFLVPPPPSPTALETSEYTPIDLWPYRRK